MTKLTNLKTSLAHGDSAAGAVAAEINNTATIFAFAALQLKGEDAEAVREGVEKLKELARLLSRSEIKLPE